MKIAVLSGKGGTGKTLLSVNLAAAAPKAVYIDCDIEEPNGRLYFKPRWNRTENITISIPEVDQKLCNGCRQCVDFCKFNALAYVREKLIVFEGICHACDGCYMMCAPKALTKKKKSIGIIQQGVSGKVLVKTGVLNIGEASGVPIIKKLIPSASLEPALQIVDCPPGSACIVMESIKEADYCVLVAEPTLFGLHNLKMVHELVCLFNKPYGVVLNKCMEGWNPSEEFCIGNHVNIIGRIPFDNEISKLNSEGLILVREKTEYRDFFSSLLKTIQEEVDNKTAIGA